jgi:hypothetical protein
MISLKLTTDDAAAFDLKQFKLRGTLPSEIQNLVWLRDLQLYSNGIEGRLPSELGNLLLLDRLLLGSNRFTGGIPDEVRVRPVRACGCDHLCSHRLQSQRL